MLEAIFVTGLTSAFATSGVVGHRDSLFQVSFGDSYRRSGQWWSEKFLQQLPSHRELSEVRL